MSRFSESNQQFEFVYGVDPVTSVFVQIWRQPSEEQDEPLFAVDNMGVRVSEEQIESGAQLPPTLRSLHEQLRVRFATSRASGNRYPNLDAETVCGLASAVGFTPANGFAEIRREIYHNLD